jgi:hypothetical protein
MVSGTNTLILFLTKLAPFFGELDTSRQ